jgi:CheY-like chemotaxis protein
VEIFDSFSGRRTLLNILLVEDNPADVRLMREALRSDGRPNHLHVVDDGEKAISFLRRTGEFPNAVRPDIVFLDLNLPRRDGREVLQEIKSDERLRRIPVIVLTTSEAERDVHRAYDLYANCYVTKPGDLDEYLNVIKACEHFWLHIVRLPG